MKKIIFTIVIVIVIVLALVGGYTYYHFYHSKNITNINNVEVETSYLPTTAASLITNNSAHCIYEDNEVKVETFTLENSLHVSKKLKSRNDEELSLLTPTHFYTWTSDTNFGVVMKINNTEAEDKIKEQVSSVLKTLDSYGLECNTENFEESMVKKPNDVNFINLNMFVDKYGDQNK